VKELSIRKYMMQELICYTYTFVTFKLYSITRTTHALDNFLELYTLIMTDNFDSAGLFYPILYDKNLDVSSPFPTYSRNFAKKIQHRIPGKKGNEIVLMNNNIILHSRYHKITLLPPPYDTNCTNKLGRPECKSQCLMDVMMKKYNRIPFSEMIDQPLDMKPLSHEDLKNKTFREEMIRLDNECHEKCRKMPCFHTFTVTLGSGFLDERINSTTKVSVFTPESPDTSVVTTEHISLVEFLIFIFSSIGIWFGITIMSSNPARIWRRWKNIKKTKVTINGHNTNVYSHVISFCLNDSECPLFMAKKPSIEGRRGQRNNYPHE